MMGAKSKLALAVGVGGVLLFVIWLFFRPQEEELVHKLIADAEQRTLPVGSRRIGTVETQRKQWSVEATWEIESDQTWEDYCSSVSDQFRKGAFEQFHRSDSKIAFRKTLTGDTLHVVVEIIGKKPLHLRVTFVGYPS
jgi:hypothetical protein